MFQKLLVLGLLGVPMIACSGATEHGAEGTDVAGDGAGPSSLAVLSEADRPACSAANKNQLVYVQDIKALQFCDGSTWRAAEIAGQPASGGSLAPSSSVRIEATIFCTGSLEDTPLMASYSAAVLTSGDIFVTGSIMDSGVEISKSTFYAAHQKGASTGSVILGSDRAGTSNGGFWELSLDRSTLVSSVKYMDTDLASTRTWTMTPDKCVKTVAS